MGKIEVLSRIHCPEKIGSDAYRMEKLSEFSPRALNAFTSSYLKEYRLEVAKDSYKLALIDGKICDPFSGEFMTDVVQRAIKRNKNEGKSAVREQAELRGFNYLESQLPKASDGDSILWFSPPGPKSEGYGDYGFVFTGSINSSQKQIGMTALRVERPTIVQFNEAFSLLTGDSVGYSRAEEFLESPRIVQGLTTEDVERVLETIFAFKVDEKKERTYREVIRRMEPMIDDFVKLLQGGKREEKEKAFYALENYALRLKERYESFGRGSFIWVNHEDVKLGDIVYAFGYKPKEVGGSCGGTAKKSNNIFNLGLKALNDILGDKKNEKEWFRCPKCGYQANGPVGDKCPNVVCGLTKQQYAESGGKTC